jgi:hypothetical protein
MHMATRHSEARQPHGQVIDLLTRRSHTHLWDNSTVDLPDPTYHETAEAVRRRLRGHEMAFLELMRAGDVEAACFEAESAEILAAWLTRHGHEPIASEDGRHLRPVN